jgi:hypothetical protein
MKKTAVRYKGHLVEPNSYQLRAGGWVPRAWVIAEGSDALTMRPVWSKTKTMTTRAQADEYAVDLGKAWIQKNA